MVFENQFNKWHIISVSDVANKEEFIRKIKTLSSIKYALVCFHNTKQCPHYHCFVELKKSCSFKEMHKLFPMAHIENPFGASSQYKFYLLYGCNDYMEYKDR